MGDDEQGAVAELLADGALDEDVGGHVDGRGRFVEHHDLGPRDDGAGETEELSLALGEVEAAFGDLGVEGLEDVGVCVGGGGGGGAAAGARFGDELVAAGRTGVADQMDAFEGVAELGVGVLVEGVEIAAHGAGEEHGVLRDDGETAAEVVQVDLGDIDAVDEDLAFAGREEAEEREGKRGFAGAGAADNTDALVLFYSKREAFEDWWELGCVAGDEVVHFETAFGGPGGWGWRAGLVFGGNAGVFNDTLGGVHFHLEISIAAQRPDDGLGVLESERKGKAGKGSINTFG